MSHSLNRFTGTLGEAEAIRYLQNKGYILQDTNFYIRGGEIDLVAQTPRGALAFIEVKARRDLAHGKPYESITPAKLKHLSKSIQLYLLKNKVQGRKLTLEVVSIIFHSDMTVKRIDHYDDLGSRLRLG
jgi:putative endonuclease